MWFMLIVRRTEALLWPLAAWRVLPLLIVLIGSAGSAEATPPPDSGASPAKLHTSPSDLAGAEEAARERVESFHDVLIDVMKTSDSEPFAEREEKVANALDASFDITFMARAAIGKTWKELDEEQQRDWIALSRQYSASNYAKNFKGHGGHRFVTHSVEPAARNTLLVKTAFVQPADDDVQLDYRLRKIDDQWRIIDVQMDGKVSEITLRRADYRAVIERKGFDELVVEVSEKIAVFERQ